MEVRQAQATKVSRASQLLSASDISRICAVGSQLLRDVEGTECRYDLGMFPIISEQQVRTMETVRCFNKKFPLIASQIKAAESRTKHSGRWLMECGVEARLKCSNAWHVAYLQANALMERFLSDVLEKIYAIVTEVDRAEGWGLLDEPYHVRVAEYHRQRAPSGAIPDITHYDEDSLVTVDILLNDGFEGGDFQTLEPNNRLARHEFQAPGDALVFVSHKYHCVTPVTRGERRVLVLEFWRGPARRCPHRCAARQKSCPLESAFIAAPCTYRGIHQWCGQGACPCVGADATTSEGPMPTISGSASGPYCQHEELVRPECQDARQMTLSPQPLPSAPCDSPIDREAKLRGKRFLSKFVKL